MRFVDLLAAVLILAALAVVAALLTRERLDGAAVAVDGDTLDMAGTHVRIAGIDAPELRQTCERDGKPWRCGEAARRALAEALRAGPVTCTARGRDRYDRPLAQCSAGGLDLADHMVRQGLAVAYLGRAHAAAEAEARAARRGIWAGTFEAPADWRTAHPRGP